MNSLFRRGSDSDGESGSWNKWARYVVNEVKRAATGVDKLEEEIKIISKEVNGVKNEITKVAASPHIEVIHTQIQNIKDDLSEIKKSVEELKKFKTEAKVIFTVSSFLFSSGLTLLGILLK
jgi:archaellum component FlaC